MHHETFTAYRKLLFLTAIEAARNVACTDERPDGVSERAWNRWEAGTAPIPQQVADNLLLLVQQRQIVIDNFANAIKNQHINYQPVGCKNDIVAYKISQSIAAQVAAMGGQVDWSLYDEQQNCFPRNRVHA